MNRTKARTNLVRKIKTMKVLKTRKNLHKYEVKPGDSVPLALLPILKGDVMHLPLYMNFTLKRTLFISSEKRQLQARMDKKIREHLTEKQIDKMIEDSFPASDPPSTY